MRRRSFTGLILLAALLSSPLAAGELATPRQATPIPGPVDILGWISAGLYELAVAAVEWAQSTDEEQPGPGPTTAEGDGSPPVTSEAGSYIDPWG